ncbi:hypothetical protein OVA26_16210 [Microbacterium sp. SL62]|uniref:hypothetical protein n=1 Tax=Microbacterium sp. SL62 TaxID=2995139 RepID=UPI0022747D59|nr:hypothetical protein [Microbacterium sp. SL62]MCY1718480.1 hypothetical protein [Microbacterium sp. SL62]
MVKRRYVNTMVADAYGTLTSHRYPRPYPARIPLPPRTPWTIDLADDVDNLFWFACFDLDAKTPDALELAIEDFGVLTRLLHRAGVPHVSCRSSRDGGFHVWVPLAGIPLTLMHELADAAGAVLKTLDSGMLRNSKSGAARPPGSPHRNGSFSQIMTGEDTYPVDVLYTPSVTETDVRRMIDSFRELRPTVDLDKSVPAGPTDSRHQAHREIPAWGLPHMQTVGGGYDPSRNAYMCLLAAAVAGWSFSDVQQAAQTAPGMEHYRTQNAVAGGRVPRRPAEAHARLRRQWDAAVQYAQSYVNYPEKRTERDLTELQGIVLSAEAMLNAFRVSPGRWCRAEADIHDSTVLTALVWMSVRSGQRKVTAAIRSVASLTGIPSTTVDRSLRRLTSAGWIERVRYAEGTEASVWRVAEKFSTAHLHVGPHHLMTARPPQQLFDVRATVLRSLEDRLNAGRSDVFTRAGLGPTARRVYESLQTESFDANDLAEKSGIPRGRLLAALSRLRRYSLAISSPQGWRRRLNDIRHRVAMKLGVHGILAQRDQAYGWEREQWAWWIAETTFRAGRTTRQRRRPDTGQVRFRLTDERGDPNSWPAYPRDVDGRADHRTAMAYIRAGALQALRDRELAA